MNLFQKLVNFFLGEPESGVIELVEREFNVGSTSIEIDLIDDSSGFGQKDMTGHVIVRGHTHHVISSQTLAEQWIASCIKLGFWTFKSSAGSVVNQQLMFPTHRIKEIRMIHTPHTVLSKVPCK